MKKFICLIIIIVVAVVIGYNVYPMINGGEEKIIADNVESNTTTVEEKEKTLSNEEIYGDVINSYKKAYEEYDIEDYESEDKIPAKYDLVSLTLITHVARYSEDGTVLTYEYYDIDKNGVDELIVGASGAPGAIYSFNKKDNQVTKVFFQDTMERGDLSIYDNGVIFSSGAGGAALHYYEFGKISEEDASYELLEKIEEEYESENKPPVYRDAETSKELKYKSYDEIVDKYLSGAKKVELDSYGKI